MRSNCAANTQRLRSGFCAPILLRSNSVSIARRLHGDWRDDCAANARNALQMRDDCAANAWNALQMRDDCAVNAWNALQMRDDCAAIAWNALQMMIAL
jgi:hypothetical protein